MDLILGGFADAAVGSLEEDQLQEFERLLETPDAELLNWFTGAAPVPAGYDTALFRQIVQQCNPGGSVKWR